MNWLKFFRLVETSKKRPLTKNTRRDALRLERLEERDVPAAPFVQSVLPRTGGTLGTTIAVQFSELVQPAGASDPNNYKLFTQEGVTVSIADVNYDPLTRTATIAASDLNGGTPLTAGAYSLFLQADQIFALDDGTPMARPGELVVASGNRGQLSSVSIIDSGLASGTTIGLSQNGKDYAPAAIATDDLDDDGLTDLVAVSSSQSVVSVYRGQAGGGFSTKADLNLTLPPGAVTNGISGIVLRDFSNDGALDIVVMNGSTGNVTSFVNADKSGQLLFNTGKTFTVAGGINGIVAGNFNNDNKLDLALSSGALNGTNYNIYVLTGNNNGTFNGATAITVGTNAPANLQAPTSLAVGRFDTNGTDDLVVGGTNGVSILLNNNGGTPAFTATFIAGNGVTSLATGAIGSNSAGFVDDIAFTSNSGGGSVGALLNNGNGTFQFTGLSSAGVITPRGLQLQDLDGFGFGAPELVYINNNTSGGLVSHASLQTGLISAATGDGTNPIVITSANHGLQTGQRVTITGVAAFPGANGTFTITVTGTNTFTLNGTTAAGTGTANTGTWIAQQTAISNITTSPTGPVTITSFNHGLRTGQQVTITGIPFGATGSLAGLNGNTFFVTVIDDNTFTLNGVTGPGTYDNTTNTANFSLPVYSTGSTPVGFVLGDFNNDDIIDAITADRFGSGGAGTLTYYRGNGSGGIGDGTFLASSNLPLNPTIPAFATATDVAVGDFNADGVPDLVATDTFNDQINIFLGIAEGGYRAPIAFDTSGIFTSARDPNSIAIGDVNGDGKLDIVVSSPSDSVVAIFTGLGDGTFNAPTYAKVGSTPTQVVLADVNNDGALDVLASHNKVGFNDRGVSLLLGNGNGTFQTATEIFTGKNAPLAGALTVGDINLDGNIDFVVTNETAPGTVRVALGLGNGKFNTDMIPALPVGNNPTAVILADFNNDGYLDIATASGNDLTSNNISVLLNNAGTGFQTAIQTSVPSGVPLNSIKATHLNSDAFIDLVVTSQAPSSSKVATPTNNTHVLYGTGQGNFRPQILDYSVVGAGSSSPYPSTAAVVSEPFQLISTFNIGSKTVKVNLINNGDFEKRDLNGEQGNLTGWTTFRLTDTDRGSAGQWLPQTGDVSPLSQTDVDPPNGFYRAMLDQQNLIPFQPGDDNPNIAASYAGSHAIYQDFRIPLSATSAQLSFSLYLNSFAAWTDSPSNPALDYRTFAANQQVRVDIVLPNGDILGVGANVLRNVFQTGLGQDQIMTVTFGGATAIDLSAFKGQTVRLRIAATNNRGQLIVGLDDVRVDTTFVDNTAPQFLSMNLRNPNYLSTPSTLPQSTDPTIVGQVTDDGGFNNIKQIVFDIAGNGFGGPDDIAITTTDARGFFTFTPTTLLPGVQNIPVRLYDQAGNFSSQVFSFILQSPSLNTFQSTGPGSIDISAANLDFTTMSGKVTSVAVDPTDPSGNTIYIGAANGGVWKTTDGGKDWLALTDNVRAPNGVLVTTPIGALALGINPATGGRVIYAATGLDDNTFTSRSGSGIMRSLDDGRTWDVLGTSTANGSVDLTGARISKMVVDPTNPNIAYITVTSWDDPTKKPMVLKTTNGLANNPANVVWQDVLKPANMFQRVSGILTALPAGTQLASVTDILVDPFNPGRLIIGLGNIGQKGISDTAGVWKSVNFGATWEKVVGGDAGIANSKIPGDNSGTAQAVSGTVIGRVTLAQGTGRVGDEEVVFVMMSQALQQGQTNEYNQGGLLGLYKSKDNMLNFTKVKLTQNTGIPGTNGTQVFSDINTVGNEGGNVGTMLVDPSNPNIVYVGGSERYGGLTYAFLRIDTGNMRDTTYVDGNINSPTFGTIPNDGDDINKWDAAWSQPAAIRGFYPIVQPDGSVVRGNPYGAGEGVYWYDVVHDTSHGTPLHDPGLIRLPYSMQQLMLDSQGRLIISTENGIYRGTQLGFGYDFSTGGDGIMAVTGSAPDSFTAPGMELSELNGNLQIADLTSIAVDPTIRDQYYVAASGTGSARVAPGLPSWQTMGLNQLALVESPNASQVIAAALPPDASPDAIARLYRVWQNRGVLVPELSTDGGVSFDPTNTSGLSAQDFAGREPVLAVNSKKAPSVNGQLFDELLFGTNQVYLSRTSGAVWDSISDRPLSRRGGTISALAFSPIDSEYLAGTNQGEVFIKRAGESQFTDITNNLSALLGAAQSSTINGIVVDPRNHDIIYVTVTTPRGVASLYKSTDGGLSWNSMSVGLPLLATYSIVIDPRATTGAPNGRLYVGSERGVFTSVDNGATWARLGQGLPMVPVVSLSFNPTLEVLAVGTQGRGVFTISTARSGPFVTGATPGTLVDGTDGLSRIDVTFNTPIDPRTFNTDSDVAARVIAAKTVLNGTEYQVTRISALELQFRRRAATQGVIDTGLQTYVTNPNTELEWISNILSSPFYYNSDFYGIGAVADTTAQDTRWLDQVFRDLLARPYTGSNAEELRLRAMLTAAPGQQGARQQVVRQLLGVNANGVNYPFAQEAQTRLAASLLNSYLSANIPLTDSNGNPIPVSLANSVYADAVNTIVLNLQSRMTFKNVVARVLASSDAYQKFGNDYALPPGVKAASVVFGNLTGTKNSVYADNNVPSNLADNFIPDLIIAGSDGKLYIFKGRVGGGYNSTADLVLNLPAGANPAQVVVGDLNGDGNVDIAVANFGDASGSNPGSVSVFINTRGLTTGLLSFAAPRVDYSAGNNPIGIAIADIDGDSNVDIAVVNRSLTGGAYTADVLLGVGGGAFNDALPPIPLGDDFPFLAELKGPTGIAVGNVTGDSKPDLIFTGDNGVLVLTNNSTPGSLDFDPLTRLTDTATTSVALGDVDGDGDLDIVTTADTANGEVLVLANDDAADTFTESRVLVGALPRSVQLGDMNGDGRLDLVVANKLLSQGTVSVLLSTTSGPGSISFANPISYPVTGSEPIAIDLADTNQDGLLDIAIGNAGSEFVSVRVGKQQGVLQTATDRTWATWLYRATLSRAVTSAERSAIESSLTAGYLVYLKTPDGNVAPLSVTPTDSSNLTYTLTFAPQLVDGTYALWIGPNSSGTNLTDFIDQNGTFTGTGNPMNQNQLPPNGENPGDRARIRFAVNTTDNGRYISTLFAELQGTTAAGGREPDSEAFINYNNTIETARLAALKSMGINVSKNLEATTYQISSLYTRYGVDPVSSVFNAQVSAVIAGQMTIRDVVASILATQEYYDEAGGTNELWLTRVYQDLLNQNGALVDPTFAPKLAALNNGSRTLLSVATGVVYGDLAIKQAIAEYFQTFLGRSPVRSPIAEFDETTNFMGVNLTALLKQQATAGVAAPDQQLIALLISTPENLRYVGNTNEAWVQQVYLKVFGRSSIDTNGSEYQTRLNNLLTQYAAARQSVLVTLTGAAAGVEFRNRKITDYYDQFLSTPGNPRVPSAAELAAGQAIFSANGNQLEAVIASIVSTNEYFSLSSSNSLWLERVYQALLGHSTASDPAAPGRLARLNNLQPGQTLQQARFQVALEILTTTEYRSLLVASFYFDYFNLVVNPADPNLVAPYVTQMNAGVRQQVIIQQLLMSNSYFLQAT